MKNKKGKFPGINNQDYAEAIFNQLPDTNTIKITDQRDKVELARRKKLGIFHPPKNELYSCNPNFDGKYSY